MYYTRLLLLMLAVIAALALVPTAFAQPISVTCADGCPAGPRPTAY